MNKYFLIFLGTLEKFKTQNISGFILASLMVPKKFARCLILQASLVCINCKERYPINSKIWRCPKCHSPLEIELQAEEEFDKDKIKQRIHSIWRYHELLPVPKKEIVTLGEGGTPLVSAELHGVDLKNLKFKMDYVNPTGSFKDRGASVSVTRLYNLGINEIIEESSGNAGAAMAAYSARAKIKCKIFTPAYASPGKIFQMKLFGAEVVTVEGTRQDVSEKALSEAEKSFFTSHLWDPFFIQGLKTIAYEIVEQLNWQVPDFVVVPIGSGGLFLGLYYGFKELSSLNIIGKLPKFIGVQSNLVNPIVRSLREGKIVYTEGRKTIAEGIAIAKPPKIKLIIEALKETKSKAIDVTDQEIFEALKELASAGFYVEPTSASVLAALKKEVENGFLDSSDLVVGILTGTGLKATEVIQEIIQRQKGGML